MKPGSNCILDRYHFFKRTMFSHDGCAKTKVATNNCVWLEKPHTDSLFAVEQLRTLQLAEKNSASLKETEICPNDDKLGGTN